MMKTFDSPSPSFSQINISNIQKGDFLVHRDHGVGKFIGLGGGGSFNEYVIINQLKVDTSS